MSTTAQAAAAARAPAGPGGLFGPGSTPGGGRYPVDYERLRTLLPGNLFFKQDLPTTDPVTLQEREEEHKKWEALYGKVLSGTGTEQEVRDYFEHRRQEYSDYKAIADKTLELYGDQLPERDRGGLELASRMHADRLKELDQKLAEALARKQQQDERRAAWEKAGRPALPQ